MYRIKSNLCAYVAWICDDSKPKWSGGGCVCVHSIYNRPPPGVIIGPIIPDGSRTVGRSENPWGQVAMWWAYLLLPPGWDRVTGFVKIGGPIAPLPPPGSNNPGQWCVSPLLFWTKLTRCDVNFYGVNMDGGFFLNTQVLIFWDKRRLLCFAVVYVTEVEWHQ